MKIVVDENIPHAREAFGAFGRVELLPGRSITRADLLDADALIVRSITSVGRALLDGTPVRFVGTATNGIDHVDTAYLADAGIAFADAAGSNANAVAEYVLASLLDLRARGICEIADQWLGIIGIGNIGGRLVNGARALGMEVVVYDPPRAMRESAFTSAGLDDLFDCDIISLHVPLTVSGEHPTWHMIDGDFIEQLRPGSTLINTSRGSVVDSEVLLEALINGDLRAAVLDVWEGEPDVPLELAERCAIATPHIAAYSFDAKLRGTEMMVHALARFLGIKNDWSAASVLPQRADTIHFPGGIDPLDAAHQAVRRAYDIARDDADFRAILPLDAPERRSRFDLLRKNYRERREFPAFGVVADDPETAALLGSLGFTLLPAMPD